MEFGVQDLEAPAVEAAFRNIFHCDQYRFLRAELFAQTGCAQTQNSRADYRENMFDFEVFHLGSGREDLSQQFPQPWNVPVAAAKLADSEAFSVFRGNRKSPAKRTIRLEYSEAGIQHQQGFPD